MKRICAVAIVFLFALISLLCACEGPVPDSPVLDFTADIIVGDEYTGGRFPITAQFTYTMQSVSVLRITTPDELCGLQYKWLDGFEMSYNELYCKTDFSYLPEDSFPQVLYNVLLDLPLNAQLQSCEDGTAVYTGKSLAGAYSVVTDSRGYIQNISVKEISLNTDFTYNDNE